MTDERFKTEFAAKLNEAAIKIVAALNTQLDYLSFFEGKQKRKLLTDVYFQRYAFGMFDAITTLLGLELRQKIGFQFIALFYVKYFILEFELDQADALDMFRNVLNFYNTHENQRDTAILDGGFDGVSVLRGDANSPQKLTGHFVVSADDNTPVTPAEAAKLLGQLPALQAFCGRDRWSDNAIREADKMAKALMSGDITIMENRKT